jgi:alpha,alpha-trehalase
MRGEPVSHRRAAAHRALWLALAFAGFALHGVAFAAVEAVRDARPPSAQFGELFARVQTEALFADSKSFADAVPLEAPARILAAYRAAPPPTRDALRAFVLQHFRMPADVDVPAAPPLRAALGAHIAALWPALIRPPLPAVRFGSALAFDAVHVVPGGRFRELYYWDSYFTLLGLVRDGHADVAEAMARGFADLIARYGHVPNGTRSYYLSRSQPPVFALIVGLLSPDDPPAAYARFLPALRAEHAYWMDGETDLAPGAARAHVVRLADGSVLNRYWDASDTPRDESYREDVALAAASGRAPATLYRELRAAAESGWDFSSRWFADGLHRATIETTAIVPVDLNALLYGLEAAIAQGCARVRDTACANAYAQRLAQRRTAIDRVLWDADAGVYFDYQWRRGARTGRLSAATLYPLFAGLASPAQAAAVARRVRDALLAPGGVATTTVQSGEQWDRPNGWAPLQWIAVQGLRRYGEDALARTIATRWLCTVDADYRRSGRLVEKYDLRTGAHGGGGEYPLQDGFGWTNGVTRALLDQYPAAIAAAH